MSGAVIELMAAGIIPENFLVEEARHPYIDEASSYGWDLKDNNVTIIGSGDIVSHPRRGSNESGKLNHD